MKKFLIILVVFSLSVSLSGCFKKEAKEEKSLKKLSDWLSSGKGVSCEVDSPMGKNTVKSEKEKVKIEGISYIDPSSQDFQVGQEAGTILNDGEWIYIWSGSKGNKMNIKEMEDLYAQDPDQTPFDPDDYSWEKWAAEQEAVEADYDCREEKFSAETFVVPAGVEFNDMGAFLREMKEMSDGFMNNLDLNQGIPQSQNMPQSENQPQFQDLPQFDGSQDLSQEDIEAQMEEMMKQFGN